MAASVEPLFQPPESSILLESPLLPPCSTIGSLPGFCSYPVPSPMDQSFWVNMKILSCVSLFRSRTRGPIGPGMYGYGKAPYILPLQTDSAHLPQRLRRQRPSSRNSRSQGASGSSHGYNPPAHRAPRHGPLYQSDSGPRPGLQVSEGSIYQLPLTHDQGFPEASNLFHNPETSSSPGLGAHRAAQSFSQPAPSTAISCIGAYRQYKLCNTNVSIHGLRVALETAATLIFLLVGSKHGGRQRGHGFLGHVNAPFSFPPFCFSSCVLPIYFSFL